MWGLAVDREELKKLGPLSTDEKITAGALAVTVALWVFGGSLNINAVAAALLGLSVLLITNVVTWKECLSDNQAWDTLTWFAALIGMAAYLNKFGFIKWFSDEARPAPPLPLLLALQVRRPAHSCRLPPYAPSCLSECAAVCAPARVSAFTLSELIRDLLMIMIAFLGETCTEDTAITWLHVAAWVESRGPLHALAGVAAGLLKVGWVALEAGHVRVKGGYRQSGYVPKTKNNGI